MGTALNLDQIYEKDPVTDSIIRTHFNAIVAENCMKSVNIHPEKDRYFWEDADAFVAYGEKTTCLSRAIPWPGIPRRQTGFLWMKTGMMWTETK